MKFLGTKGKLELKYVSGICIGIGTIDDIDGFAQITANSILPETDEEYEKEKDEIEANMLLYSKSPEMLEMLKKILTNMDWSFSSWGSNDGLKFKNEIEQLIKKATKK